MSKFTELANIINLYLKFYSLVSLTPIKNVISNKQYNKFRQKCL